MSAGPQRRGRVLLVDDDAVTRRICEVTMHAHLLDIVTCASGEDAVALGDLDFDLVIIDIHLPLGIDGWATIEQLRAAQQAANVGPAQIVVLTTDDSSAARSRSRALGIDEHLIKPAGMTRLNELARSISRPREG